MRFTHCICLVSEKPVEGGVFYLALLSIVWINKPPLVSVIPWRSEADRFVPFGLSDRQGHERRSLRPSFRP